MAATELAWAGLVAQADLVRRGEVSARELTELALARIARLDPEVNAFRVVRAEAALAAAEAADARRRNGADGPLNGVPVAVKDDTDVAGEATALGLRPRGAAARADAEPVARLRAAGAVLVGKTHVPELACAPVTETIAHGATRNPWDLARTPGGSSGGSAAAVAAGLVGVALGTDGAGSLRIPAACCGLVGLKPGAGRVPRGGRETWHGLSVHGPLARRVVDAARLLDVIADGDLGLEAAATAAAPGRLRVAVSLRLPPPVLARVRPEQLAALRATADLLSELGHEVDEAHPAHRPAASARFLARYLSGLRREAALVPDPRELSPLSRGLARLGALVPERAARRARERAAADAGALWRPLEGADVLLTPVLTRLPPRVGAFSGRGPVRTLDAYGRWIAFCPPSNHAGDPALALPAGTAPDGLPVGVQLVARRGGEALLVALAAQLEAARPWADRRPPIAA